MKNLYLSKGSTREAEPVRDIYAIVTSEAGVWNHTQAGRRGRSIPSLLRLIPRLFSFRDSAQTQMHRYAHTFTYTHKYICTHMHTPAHTHIHTHTPFNVQVLTLHSCSHTNIYTDMQTNTPTGTHTHTHHSSTQTQMRTYSHIYSHTPLHSLRRIFFLNCWNLLLFQVGNVAAAPIPEASFSSQPQLLCHHCTLRFKLTPCSWVSPAPATTSPALSRMCQAPAKASCKYFVMPRGGDASIFVSTFCFHLAFSWPVKRWSNSLWCWRQWRREDVLWSVECWWDHSKSDL